MGGHLFRNWTGELCHKERQSKKQFSHKKAQKAQNEFGLAS